MTNIYLRLKDMIRFVEQKLERVSRGLAVVKSFKKSLFFSFKISSASRIFSRIYSLVED